MNTKQIAFLNAVKQPSLGTEKQFGIPAVVTVAQAVVESATPPRPDGSGGWGTSTLYLNANNPFGIKYSSEYAAWGSYSLPTWEVVNGQREDVEAAFQKFPSLTEAFLEHGKLLLGPRYLPAYEVRSDWQQFAQRLGPKTDAADLVHCGYSTNPKYGDLLTEIIEGSNLLAFLGSV